MFCIVYELLYDNYMGITWQLYVKYKVITRMAFSQGGIPILQEWIFRVGRMPCKLACKGVRPTNTNNE